VTYQKKSQGIEVQACNHLFVCMPICVWVASCLDAPCRFKPLNIRFIAFVFFFLFPLITSHTLGSSLQISLISCLVAFPHLL
jgi:hypothetical protein